MVNVFNVRELNLSIMSIMSFKVVRCICDAWQLYLEEDDYWTEQTILWTMRVEYIVHRCLR